MRFEAEEVRAMLDREAIRDLPIRYCHYLRQHDLEAVLDLFADDAVMDLSAGIGAAKASGLDGVRGGLWSGREGLREGFASGLRSLDPWAFVHNHVVDLQGADRAVGSVHVEVRLPERGLRTTLLTIYEDEYVKQDSIWRFKMRRLRSSPVTE